jgi:hypothetical protein
VGVQFGVVEVTPGDRGGGVLGAHRARSCSADSEMCLTCDDHTDFLDTVIVRPVTKRLSQAGTVCLALYKSCGFLKVVGFWEGRDRWCALKVTSVGMAAVVGRRVAPGDPLHRPVGCSGLRRYHIGKYQ